MSFRSPASEDSSRSRFNRFGHSVQRITIEQSIHVQTSCSIADRFAVEENIWHDSGGFVVDSSNNATCSEFMHKKEIYDGNMSRSGSGVGNFPLNRTRSPLKSMSRIPVRATLVSEKPKTPKPMGKPTSLRFTGSTKRPNKMKSSMKTPGSVSRRSRKITFSEPLETPTKSGERLSRLNVTPHPVKKSLPGPSNGGLPSTPSVRTASTVSGEQFMSPMSWQPQSPGSQVVRLPSIGLSPSLNRSLRNTSDRRQSFLTPKRNISVNTLADLSSLSGRSSRYDRKSMSLWDVSSPRLDLNFTPSPNEAQVFRTPKSQSPRNSIQMKFVNENTGTTPELLRSRTFSLDDYVPSPRRSTVEIGSLIKFDSSVNQSSRSVASLGAESPKARKTSRSLSPRVENKGRLSAEKSRISDEGTKSLSFVVLDDTATPLKSQKECAETSRKGSKKFERTPKTVPQTACRSLSEPPRGRSKCVETISAKTGRKSETIPAQSRKGSKATKNVSIFGQTTDLSKDDTVKRNNRKSEISGLQNAFSDSFFDGIDRLTPRRSRCDVKSTSEQSNLSVLTDSRARSISGIGSAVTSNRSQKERSESSTRKASKKSDRTSSGMSPTRSISAPVTPVQAVDTSRKKPSPRQSNSPKNDSVSREINAEIVPASPQLNGSTKKRSRSNNELSHLQNAFSDSFFDGIDGLTSRKSRSGDDKSGQSKLRDSLRTDSWMISTSKISPVSAATSFRSQKERSFSSTRKSSKNSDRTSSGMSPTRSISAPVTPVQAVDTSRKKPSPRQSNSPKNDSVSREINAEIVPASPQLNGSTKKRSRSNNELSHLQNAFSDSFFDGIDRLTSRKSRSSLRTDSWVISTSKISPVSTATSLRSQKESPESTSSSRWARRKTGGRFSRVSPTGRSLSTLISPIRPSRSEPKVDTSRRSNKIPSPRKSKKGQSPSNKSVSGETMSKNEPASLKSNESTSQRSKVNSELSHLQNKFSDSFFDGIERLSPRQSRGQVSGSLLTDSRVIRTSKSPSVSPESPKSSGSSRRASLGANKKVQNPSLDSFELSRLFVEPSVSAPSLHPVIPGGKRSRVVTSTPKIQPSPRKYDALAKSQEAANRLKAEGPKLLDKKKMAAIMVCHKKKTSPVKDSLESTPVRMTASSLISADVEEVRRPVAEDLTIKQERESHTITEDDLVAALGLSRKSSLVAQQQQRPARRLRSNVNKSVNVSQVRRLFFKAPEDDYVSHVDGLKHALGLKPEPSYDNVRGIKTALQLSPKADYSNVNQLKRVFTTSPVVDYTDVSGVKKLFLSPPTCDSSGIRELLPAAEILSPQPNLQESPKGSRKRKTSSSEAPVAPIPSEPTKRRLQFVDRPNDDTVKTTSAVKKRKEPAEVKTDSPKVTRQLRARLGKNPPEPMAPPATKKRRVEVATTALEMSPKKPKRTKKTVIESKSPEKKPAAKKVAKTAQAKNKGSPVAKKPIKASVASKKSAKAVKKPETPVKQSATVGKKKSGDGSPLAKKLATSKKAVKPVEKEESPVKKRAATSKRSPVKAKKKESTVKASVASKKAAKPVKKQETAVKKRSTTSKRSPVKVKKETPVKASVASKKAAKPVKKKETPVKKRAAMSKRSPVKAKKESPVKKPAKASAASKKAAKPVKKQETAVKKRATTSKQTSTKASKATPESEVKKSVKPVKTTSSKTVAAVKSEASKKRGATVEKTESSPKKGSRTTKKPTRSTTTQNKPSAKAGKPKKRPSLVVSVKSKKAVTFRND